MAHNRIIVGIDIGTARIATLIASQSKDEPINIMGVSSIPSRGIRKGQVVDIDEAIDCISASLEGAERMAGYSVSSAFVSVGGSHISSINSHGVVAVSEPDKEISESDVARAVEAAKAISFPSNREILHVLPRGFIVDSQDGIKDPVGMTGVRLEVDTHLITGGLTALRNLTKCINEVGIDVDGLVFSGLASAESTLSETEKELGVILMDIGAGTMDVCIFVEGALAYSSVLPIGAKNITNDLAIGLRVSLESAEKIKLALIPKEKKIVLPEEEKEETRGTARSVEKKKNADEIDLSRLMLPEGIKKVPKKTVIDGIINPRLHEIFGLLSEEIKKSGFGGMTPSGVVLTGGGAETVGIVEAAKRNLVMPVRIGCPGMITGLTDEVLTPSFATGVGLLIYGSGIAESGFPKYILSLPKLVSKIPIKGVTGKIVDLVKSFLP